MKDPRAHHYVPQFYLKAFADPSLSQPDKPRIWVYDKGKAPRLSTPRHEANQRDFYSFEDEHGKKISMEGVLSKVESDIAPTLRKCANPDYFFTHSEKEELATFVALMFIRNPSGRQFIDRTFAVFTKARTQALAKDATRFKAAVEKFQTGTGSPIDADEMREFILGGDWDIQQKSAAFNLEMMSWLILDVTPVLAETNWTILHTDGKAVFLTSDSPVFSIVPDGQGQANVGMGFGMPGVEIYFPVNSRTCLMMCQTGCQGTATVSERMVRQINSMTMVGAGRFVYASLCSEEIRREFDTTGCQVIYGVNALVPFEFIKANG